ncbi:phosphatidylethanolamine N-methyltransferase family protein [Seohaeicola saemankumensis]|nr:PEMT/PEM2 methyltransferase family protein [Seohaeicola saemankumensis]MCA0869317.1 phosphatidylethanolamine N-methyltransferase family protein [Seohaeicola saemankumensis]
MTHFTELAHTVSLTAAALSALALAALLAANLVRPSLGMWPAAPDTAPVRHHLIFGLFRLFCGATIAFALTGIAVNGWGHWPRYALGLPLMVAAFGVTLWGYRFLGLDNTYCDRSGLVTGGIYAYSRNPQYVTSVLATIGLGVTAGSTLTLVLAGVLFLLYFLFVLNEERWLIHGYGRAFVRYMRSTPRFIGLRSLIRFRREVLKTT